MLLLIIKIDFAVFVVGLVTGVDFAGFNFNTSDYTDDMSIHWPTLVNAATTASRQQQQLGRNNDNSKKIKTIKKKKLKNL